MTGAMYASIAGLKAHMQKLSVIGNNVANVNTTAYKKHRTVFRDSLYTMYTSGSNGSQVVGGKNPSQLGFGSLVANIDLDMSTSSYNPGNPMDCAIVGDGFFLVGNKDVADIIDPTNPESFKSLTLTRSGDFKFGADGYLTDGPGNAVYGFLVTGINKATGKPIVSDQLVPIRIPKMEKVIVDKDTEIPVEDQDSEDLFDDNGDLLSDYKYSYTIHYPVDKADDENTGTGGGTGGTDGPTYQKIQDYWPVDGEGNPVVADVNPLAYATLDSIEIDANTGAITGNCKETEERITIGYLALGNVTNPNGVSHAGNNYYTAGAGAGDLRITMLGGVQSELGITHVNGSIKELYADAPADGGAAGGGNDDTTVELPQLAEVTSSGTTTLLTGFLEAPNVDLATEISELITTQRGYQANTRIITVTDSMLEELVNMKR